MEKISVLIITKNSEDVVGDAIESVKDLADEVIVLDGESTDDTKKISEKFGARVVVNKFKNFSEQRNLAIALAKSPWIFFLDSDEQATPEFIKELKLKIENFRADEDIAGFWIKRKTFFLNKDWKTQDRLPRVFKKDRIKGFRGIVHETPDVSGRLDTVQHPILHYTHRNLAQMVEKTNDWSEFEARLRLEAKHPKMNTWRFIRVMLTGFMRSYFKEGGWKNGTEGMIESIFQAFSMFITYAKLWEKQVKN